MFCTAVCKKTIADIFSDKLICYSKMESSLPESLTSTPLAPVAFVGLDIPNITKTSGRHTTIWHAFTAERSPDRVPLKVLYTNNLKPGEMGVIS